MIRLLLLLLMIPAASWAWTLTDRCELTRETPKGTVSVSPTTSGILLYLPEGLVADDTLVRVGVGRKSWRMRMVGGAVELKGGAKPFLEQNWMTVHVDGKQVLGFNLSGSSTEWEKLEDCEPAVAGGGWVSLSGEIAASTDDQIIGAIRRQRPEGLLLDSAGGLAAEAQRIGYAVREARMATKVEANGKCLSECTFVLAAGTPRTIDAGGRVGIPASMITKGLGVLLSGQGSVADSAVYFNGMGVNGGKMAVLATSAQKDGIRVFTPTELRDLGFVDTSAPKATAATIATGFSNTDGGDWWLLAGLLGVGALGWGLAGIWRRA
jgi:hypothetical protein